MGMYDDDDVGGDELIGADEIVGAVTAIGGELDDILDSVSGDVPPKAANKLARVAKKMREMRAIDPNAVRIEQRSPSRRRDWHAPFPATVINAGATSLLQMLPQEIFRTERLFIPSNIAQDMNITVMQVGQKNELLVSGEINGTVFSEVAIRSFLTLDTANIGNTITLGVRNDGLAAVAPRPDFLGTVAV